MLKLRRLRVEKFRSLAKGAELRFSDGINVLLGQNGTGKTTLLELISMVVRSDFSSLAKEEFAVEYELAVDGGESLIVIIRNERVAVGQGKPPFELSAREVFRPSAEVQSGADRRHLLRYDPEHGLSVEGEPPIGHMQAPSCLDRAFLLFYATGAPAISFVALELGNTAVAYRFDESLDLFRMATDTGDIMGNIFINRDEWGPYPVEWPFVPRSLIMKLSAKYEVEKSDYSFSHEELGFLSTIKDMMGFSGSELRIDIAERISAKQGLLNVLKVGTLLFRFRWEDGTFITHERLSYGQKRLVAFFYYLACNPYIMIADELVNGLHHRWISAAIESLGQRQAFLTSQNPLLLDYIPITSPDQVQKSFVLCRGEPREGRPAWIWENMTDEDAAQLFSAYEVGIEHVSEILQSRGLW